MTAPRKLCPDLRAGPRIAAQLQKPRCKHAPASATGGKRAEAPRRRRSCANPLMGRKRSGAGDGASLPLRAAPPPRRIGLPRRANALVTSFAGHPMRGGAPVDGLANVRNRSKAKRQPGSPSRWRDGDRWGAADARKPYAWAVRQWGGSCRVVRSNANDAARLLNGDRTILHGRLRDDMRNARPRCAVRRGAGRCGPARSSDARRGPRHVVSGAVGHCCGCAVVAHRGGGRPWSTGAASDPAWQRPAASVA